MTKTAYARRYTPAELAEFTKDMSPEDREEFRIEDATSPLFDMFLRFRDIFADRAIDRLDITDEDAEAMAKKMEDGDAGSAYAHLLRQIVVRRRLRVIGHKVSAIWASEGTSEGGISLSEVDARYEKLQKGDA